jgi:hypothetical protein
MFQMASRGANSRPDMLGPLPARLVSRPTNDEFANPNGFKFSLLELYNFIRLFESFQNYLVHVISFRS